MPNSRRFLAPGGRSGDGHGYPRRWRVSFAWYDLWVGVFYDRRKRTVYVCPLPTLLIEWRRA